MGEKIVYTTYSNNHKSLQVKTLTNYNNYCFPFFDKLVERGSENILKKITRWGWGNQRFVLCTK